MTPRPGATRARAAAWPLAVRTLAAIALAAAPLACGRAERPAAADSATPDTPIPAPVAAGPDDCPRSGAWRACSVLDRLEAAGLAPVARDSVRHSFLSVPGAVYAVGRGELQLFLYPDAAARARDFAGFDTVRVQPADTTIAWPDTPSLIQSNNLAAILLSANETQVERVRLALTAGLPEK